MGYIEDHHDDEMHEDYLKTENMSKELTTQSELLLCFTEQGIPEKEAKDLLKAASEITEKITSWDKLADIEVTSVEQIQEMKTADENRLSVKRDRLVVEHFTKSKREAVQGKMSSFKKEDTAWLRLNQYVEKKAKDLEDKLKIQAEFKERFEKEQRENLKTEQFEKLSAVCEHAASFPLPMEETAFGKLLEDMTLAKQEKERLAAIAEQQRLADEEAERVRLEKEQKQIATQKIRLSELMPFNAFVGTLDMTALWELDDKVYQKVLKDAEKACKDKKLADEKAVKKQTAYQEKVDKRIGELCSHGLKYDFGSTYVGFGFFIDIIDIKTYEDLKWESLIKRLAGVVETCKSTQSKRIEELVTLGTPVSEAMALIGLETSESEYNELLEEVKKTPVASEEVVYPEKPDVVVAVENPNKSESLGKTQIPVGTYELGVHSNRPIKSWVDTFKIEPMFEEDLSEEEKIVYQDIFAKFNGFKDWAEKRLLK